MNAKNSMSLVLRPLRANDSARTVEVRGDRSSNHDGPSADATRVARVPRMPLIRSVLYQIAAMLAGMVASAAEPSIKESRPVIGKWYTWKDAAGHDWDAMDIVSLGREPRVTFLSRRAPEQEQTEHFRAILFSQGAKVLPLPYNVGGKQRIDVFWYDATAEEGPFLRLSDRWGEYLVDVRHNTTARVVRLKGRAFVGLLRSGEDKAAMSYDDEGNRCEVSVAGRPAREIIGPVASQKGRKVGEISGR
jgi:hypothetical protein